MKKELEKILESIIKDEKIVLSYLKSRYPLFHKSNVFFRDIQFGLKHFLENRNIYITYTESEQLAQQFIQHLESNSILKKISENIYLLNYPEFVPQKSTAKT